MILAVPINLGRLSNVALYAPRPITWLLSVLRQIDPGSAARSDYLAAFESGNTVVLQLYFLNYQPDQATRSTQCMSFWHVSDFSCYFPSCQLSFSRFADSV